MTQNSALRVFAARRITSTVQRRTFESASGQDFSEKRRLSCKRHGVSSNQHKHDRCDCLGQLGTSPMPFIWQPGASWFSPSRPRRLFSLGFTLLIFRLNRFFMATNKQGGCRGEYANRAEDHEINIQPQGHGDQGASQHRPDDGAGAANAEGPAHAG